MTISVRRLPMQQNKIRTFLAPSETYANFRRHLQARKHVFSRQRNQLLATVYYRGEEITRAASNGLPYTYNGDYYG